MQTTMDQQFQSPKKNHLSNNSSNNSPYDSEPDAPSAPKRVPWQLQQRIMDIVDVLKAPGLSPGVMKFHYKLFSTRRTPKLRAALQRMKESEALQKLKTERDADNATTSKRETSAMAPVPKGLSSNPKSPLPPLTRVGGLARSA